MFLEHKSFYMNTLWQYGLQVVKYVLPLLVMPYLTRVLEPTGYAVYAYVVSFMSFAQAFVDFGFNLSGTRQIAIATDAGEQERIVGSITQARLILCVLTGFGCAAIALFIPMLRENALYATLAYLAVCGKALAPDFLFQGREKMGPLTSRYLISKGLSVILTFVFVHSSSDLLWVPTLDILASIVALVWSFISAKRLFGIGIAWVPICNAVSELKRSAYYCVTNMASVALSGVTTLVIGIAISDSAQVAYWSLAMSAINAVQSLYSPIINSLYPHMIIGGDFSFAKRLVLLSVPFVLIGSIIFYVGAELIILILGGEEYLPGVDVMRLLSPIVPLSFYAMFFGWPILGAVNRVKELTKTTVVSSVFGIAGLLVAWMSGNATIGAFCIARSITEALLCGLRVHECRKALRENMSPSKCE